MRTRVHRHAPGAAPRPDGRAWRVAGTALIVVLALAACDQAQQVVDQAAGGARQAAESATADAATAAIGTATTKALGASGIELVSAPDCRSDLQVDGVAVKAQGTVTCVARTTERQAVRSVFDGTLSAKACTGTLTIDVQGREPITVPKVSGCRIAAIVGGSGEGSES